MNALETEEATFEAQIEGIFPENAYPAETRLRLREGAQVMFVRNDTSGEGRYYNGKIATVKKVKPALIVEDESGESIEVNTERWENIRYSLNEESGEIEGIVEGTFEQVPLRPAWAVTIHKSSGTDLRPSHHRRGRGILVRPGLRRPLPLPHPRRHHPDHPDHTALYLHQR